MLSQERRRCRNTPFGCDFMSRCVGIKESRDTQTHSASSPVISPALYPFVVHTNPHDANVTVSRVSCHNLMFKLLRLGGIVWFKKKKKSTIQWALLIYHWWLCHLLPKIYLFNNLYGDKVLFILYYFFLFKCISFSQNQHYWAREYNLLEHKDERCRINYFVLLPKRK